MGYGELDELLGDMSNAVTDARKMLKELYQILEKSDLLEAKALCLKVDIALLDGIDTFNEETDGIDASGSKCKPKWLKEQK